jgi:Zn-dependent M28 family amino/carboxypeptidase
MKATWWVGALAAVAVAVVLLTEMRPGALRTDGDSEGASGVTDEIREEEIAAHLQFLSDDLLEGRAPSTRGDQIAAKYLAAQLALLGYEPGGDNNTYFQQVPIVESTVNPSFTLTAGPGRPFTYLDEVVAFSGVQEPQVKAGGELVFVGHGIVAPEYEWNDYAGADVKGKIVLVMVNDPPATSDEPNLFGGPALTYYGRWTYKYEEAARQGAAGAILIHTDESATYPWQVVRSSWSGTQYSIPVAAGTPVLPLKAWVTNDAAKEIARRAGKDLDVLRRAADMRGTPAVPLGIQVSATIVQRVAQRTTPNVIGLLRGRNPAQGVIYTAHHDHLGMQEPRPGDKPDVDRIYNGAIDNASGLGGTLAIARSLARRGQPDRSIYVMFTTAEESGLLGAEYFAAHPVLPAEAWAADINIDSLNMAGRSRDIVLLGAERSTLGEIAASLAKERDREVGPDPTPNEGHFFRSDHFPLAKVGIPALSLSDPVKFLTNVDAAKKRHEEYVAHDYHQPSDEVKDWWDYSGAVEDMTFLAELGWRIANQPEMPTYHANEQFARPRLKQ